MIQAGEALEWALALQQAPSRRAMVRAQPLPADLTELLSIAGGSVASLESAARRVGATEPAVLDAARFFVQQAMLFDGADAYRVLGVARNADAGLIRDHHRLLLRWLHPDRSSTGGQWDSAFSGRVNWAWNLVRTEAARAAYDSTLAGTSSAAPGFTEAPMPQRSGGRRPGFVAAGNGNAAPAGHVAPLAVLLVTLACAALAWLVVRREAELDRIRDADLAPVAQAGDAATRPWTHGAQPAPPRGLDAVRRAAAAMALGPPERRPASPLAREMALAREMPVTPDVPLPDAAAAPIPPVRAGAGSTQGSPALAGVDDTDAAPDVPQQIPQTAQRTAPQSTPQPGPQPGANAAPVELAWAASGTPAAFEAPVADATSPAPAVADETDPLRLMQQAQARVRSVTRYLLADAPPPAWADAAARGNGDSIRDGMRTRLAGGQAREIRLLSPHWRLDTGSARVRSRYAVDAGDQAIEQGELAIDLARRDGQWQVASLRLVPGP